MKAAAPRPTITICAPKLARTVVCETFCRPKVAKVSLLGRVDREQVASGEIQRRGEQKSRQSRDRNRKMRRAVEVRDGDPCESGVGDEDAGVRQSFLPARSGGS